MYEELSAERRFEMFKGTRILVLDIETTGLGKQASIIELGLIELINGEVVRDGTTLFGGGSSEEKALECHGITDEERIGKLTFAEQAPNFKKIIETVKKDDKERDLKTVIVGHNVIRFDIPKLFENCRLAGAPIVLPSGKILVCDTLPCSKKHLASPNHKLETLCSVYGVEHGKHRGLGDSYSSLEILCVIMEKANISHVSQICERKAI